MSTHVSDMSKHELQEMIEETIERKLIELFGDPDEGLVLQDDMRERLLRQQKDVKQGVQGRSMNEVLIDLGLE